jgi:hypothetical protein
MKSQFHLSAGAATQCPATRKAYASATPPPRGVSFHPHPRKGSHYMPNTDKPLPLWSDPPASRSRLNSAVLPGRKEDGSASPPSQEPRPDSSPATPKAAESSASAFSAARCKEKGCIFPAEFAALGKCIHHHRELTEPDLFCSLQPTLLLLGQAKYGLPESEPDDSRFLDRRRQAAEREAFQLEEAA